MDGVDGVRAGVTASGPPGHGLLGLEGDGPRVLDTASPPSLEQNLGGARYHPRMAAGTQDHPLKGGGGLTPHTSGRLLGQIAHGKTGMVL